MVQVMLSPLVIVLHFYFSSALLLLLLLLLLLCNSFYTYHYPTFHTSIYNHYCSLDGF